METAPLIEKLIEKLKTDRNMQTSVYNQYYRRVYTSCLRILNDPHRAEDFMQEAFLQAFRSIDSYRGEANLCSWICRIAINRCLDFIKKRKLDLHFDDQWENHDSRSYELDNDADGYQVERIKHALTLLPEGCRIIFNLHIFEEMDHKTIAERLGIKEGSSRAQYVRAKTKIREMIGNHG